MDKTPLPPMLGFVLGALTVLAVVTTILLTGCEGWLEPVSSNRTPIQVVTDSLNRVASRMASQDGYQAVKVTDHYVFCHPRGNADKIPGTGQTYDDKNLQKAINWAQNQGRELRTLGANYYTNDGLRIAQYTTEDIKDLRWIGSHTRLVATDPGPWAFIGSQDPADMNQAHQMVERKPIIHGITFVGTGEQTGIDIGPSYGADFQYINGRLLEWVVFCRFGLETTVRKTYATHCTNGWAFSIGDWPGADKYNSQSNISSLSSARWYGNSPGGVGVWVHQSYGVKTEDIYIEGHTIGVPYYLDAEGSTTVKGHTWTRCGLETTGGVTEAAYKIRMAGGQVVINDPGSGYPSIMVDCKSTPGYTQVVVNRCMWWVPKDGKIFNNLGNTSWKINDCDGQLYGDNLAHLFDGQGVANRCGVNSGYNTYCVNPINR